MDERKHTFSGSSQVCRMLLRLALATRKNRSARFICSEELGRPARAESCPQARRATGDVMPWKHTVTNIHGGGDILHHIQISHNGTVVLSRRSRGRIPTNFSLLRMWCGSNEHSSGSTKRAAATTLATESNSATVSTTRTNTKTTRTATTTTTTRSTRHLPVVIE